ncbi:hypothetical protein ACFL5B_01285 [Candidatus Latescibacterota bacterium]
MNKQNLREYWKFNFFTVFFGFGGSVWGGLTFFIGIPVAYLTYLNASSMQIGLITAIFWAGFAVPLPIIFGKLMDMGILNYNSMFTISFIMMGAAIIYILTVIENPKAFTELKAGTKG